MQRQSLGSPSSRSHLSAAGGRVIPAGSEEEAKAEKPIRCGSRVARSIHLIPVLTLLCLLVLYLLSHNPTPEDMAAEGDGATLRLDPKATAGAEGVSAIRSKRGLKASAAGGGRRSGGSFPNRKLGMARRGIRA
ncbi:hypothetical protein Cni_G07391 [Canna indica]|uniref:Uncharacterized protein n=1 Tax=Canna indica TaxID=4628 RepID=A0AAQ3Q7H3_9LILI|nr:hypothetical protein Cni_G07391 [Canna indica]